MLWAWMILGFMFSYGIWRIYVVWTDWEDEQVRSYAAYLAGLERAVTRVREEDTA